MSENLQTRIYTKKPEKDSFFNFQIDWRLLLALFFILFIIGVAPAIIYSIKYIENNYTMDVNTFNIVYFCNFLLVINYFIFTYTMCIYYARKYKKGPKGGKGTLGDTGHQGVDSSCDICSKKTTVFKRREDITGAKEIVDSSVLTKLQRPNFDNWIKTPQTTNNLLGSVDVNTNQNNRSASKTYFNGATVGYNSTTNDILSIQFLEDGNGTPNRKKINNVLNKKRFGNTNISNYYDGMKKAFHIKTDDFKCPPGSGISKIETLSDEENLKGISFQCKNLNTGKINKIKDSSNNLSNKISFSVKPDNTKVGEYSYSSFECDNGNDQLNFINNISANETSDVVNSLKVNKCSYYKRQ
jgi:hypothetical protein